MTKAIDIMKKYSKGKTGAEEEKKESLSVKKRLFKKKIRRQKPLKKVSEHKESPVNLEITSQEELIKRQLLIKYPKLNYFMIQKYDNDIYPEVAYRILAEGKTFHSILKELQISYGTFQKWIKNHEKFRFAVEMGLSVSYEWWLEVGRENLWNPKFNNSMYEMQMRNRFKWVEKNLSEKDMINNINVINNVSSMVAHKDSSGKKLDLKKLSFDELQKLKEMVKKSEEKSIEDAQIIKDA